VSMLHGAWGFLWLAGHLARAEEWLNLAGQTGVALTPIQRGRAEWVAGSIAFETGRYHEGRELVEASLEKLRGTDDRRTLAWAEFMCALLQPAFGVPAEETREAI